MTPNPFAKDLAEEHLRDLRQQIFGHRSSSTRSAPLPRRASVLTVRVRPVRPGDAPLLADIFARLSPASRYARFLAAKVRLTDAELRYLTEVDHHNHEALIALTRLGGEPVGVARFIRDRDNPASAEIAAEVVDAWQDRGVGSLLVSRIAERAQSEDISELTALMLAGNHRSARLLAKAGGITHVTRDGTTLSYRVALPAPPGRPHFGRLIDACTTAARLLSMVDTDPAPVPLGVGRTLRRSIELWSAPHVSRARDR